MTATPKIRRRSPRELMTSRKRARWPLAAFAGGSALAGVVWAWDAGLFEPPGWTEGIPSDVIWIATDEYDLGEGSLDEVDAEIKRRVQALRVLDLGPEARHTFEDFDADWLAELPNLEVLRIDLSDPEGLHAIADMGQFTYVSGAHRVHMEDRPYLPSLRYLSVVTNAEQDWSAFADAPNLEHLVIVSCIGQDLTPFAGCPSLRSVTVRDAPGDIHSSVMDLPNPGDPSLYASLTQITTLEIPDARKYDGFEPLTNILGLRHLTVRLPDGGEEVGLNRIPNLKTLTLVEPSIRSSYTWSDEQWSEWLPNVDVRILDVGLMDAEPWKSRVPQPELLADSGDV
ncbi:MAG: hypothetical protein AAGI22_26550 [Planctomycetota bacterium]